jgi:hypothetical protein
MWTSAVNNSSNFEPSKEHLNGLVNYEIVILDKDETRHEFIDRIDYDESTCSSHVYFRHFPPGAVLALKCGLNERLQKNLRNLKQRLFADETDNALNISINKLDSEELSIALFKKESEEQSEIESGMYVLNNGERLVYGGVQGVMEVLERERSVWRRI